MTDSRDKDGSIKRMELKCVFEILNSIQIKNKLMMIVKVLNIIEYREIWMKVHTIF
jgi:hypothetical protein